MTDKEQASQSSDVAKVEASAPKPSKSRAKPKKQEQARIGVRDFIEETPRLSREARDILMRLHGIDRKTRSEWQKLAKQFGGER